MPRTVQGKVCVIGLGYIGLPTAAIFASRGYEVVGVDVQRDVVDSINSGEAHFSEPNLEEIIKDAVAAGYLRAEPTPEPANAFIIAVPTPFTGASREPDLSYIKKAAESISPVLKRDDLVILESTSPVGTTDLLANWLAAMREDLSFPQTAGEQSDIRIAHCPERVMPGNTLWELVNNDRVIGGITSECAKRAQGLYQAFANGQCVIASGSREAEMAKLAENSFRDVNIAFANELSLICDGLGVNVWEVIRLSNMHPRVNILRPGAGVGGHCIAVDPWFVISSSPAESKLMRCAREINDTKPEQVVVRILRCIDDVERMSGTADKIKLAIYGITYKPNSDDLRGSPPLQIAQRVIAAAGQKIELFIVEPNLTVLPDRLAAGELVHGQPEADINVILMKHDEFESLPEPKYFTIDVVGLSAA